MDKHTYIGSELTTSTGADGLPAVKTLESVSAAATQGENVMSTHGQERGPGQRPTQQFDDTKLETPVHSSGHKNPPYLRDTGFVEATPNDQAGDSDEERLAGMVMIDRANSGRPVLSGPADLGLKEDDQRPKDAGQEESSQLQEPENGQVSSLTPVSPIL